MKTYTRYKDVLASLRAFIADSLARGENILPGERELSVKFGTSHITLRKALKELEDEKLIECDRNFRKLLPQGTCRGRFVFIANGRRDTNTITSYAYDRLWKHVRQMATASGFNVSLYIWDKTEDPFADGACPEEIKGVDAAFVSLLGGDGVRNFFDGLSRQTSNIFVHDMQMEKYSKNLICLDNFAAGEIAAGEILKSGYSNPVCIGCRRAPSFIPFEQRAEAFMSVMKKNGINASVSWIDVEMMGEFPEKAKKRLKKLVEAGHDAFFLISDEWIDFIIYDLMWKNRVPEIGIITVDGSNSALRHLPPLTCVSHASKGVASEIISVMKRISACEADVSVRKLIRPEIYKGLSLK